MKFFRYESISQSMDKFMHESNDKDINPKSFDYDYVFIKRWIRSNIFRLLRYKRIKKYINTVIQWTYIN